MLIYNKKLNNKAVRAKLVNEDLTGMPKDIAWKLFKSDKKENFLIKETIKALDLENGGFNKFILTKIHNECQRRLGITGPSAGTFYVPKLTENASEEDMKKTIEFIEKADKINKEFKNKLNDLINDYIK
jgi:hypothetical protein